MKNCIMWSIYGDARYFNFLDISLKSASIFSKSIDRIVVKDTKCEYKSENCKTIITDYPIESASRMAHRYDCAADLLCEYDHVLHIDADALICKDIFDIFYSKQKGLSVASESSINKKHFKSIEKYTCFVTDEYWAGPLLTDDEKILYNQTPSICMGVWLAGKEDIDLLRSMSRDVLLYESRGYRGPCLDQHAAVRNLILSNMWNFSLQEHVTHLGLRINSKEDILELNNSPAAIVHFAGGVLPTQEKLSKMTQVFNDISRRKNVKR